MVSGRESLERTVTGGLVELAALANEVEDRAVGAGLESRDARRLALVIDELGSNAVRHGAARHVTVQVEFSAELSTITISDDGTAFDPRGAPTPGRARSPGVRKTGGRGLRLVRAIATIVDYAGEGGINRVTVELQGRGPSGRKSPTGDQVSDP